MKGKSEKNEITFKNRRKFDFINEERKKHREADNPAHCKMIAFQLKIK